MITTFFPFPLQAELTLEVLHHIFNERLEMNFTPWQGPPFEKGSTESGSLRFVQMRTANGERLPFGIGNLA